MSLATSSLGTIIPRDNCSTRQLFLSTIVPRNNYSSAPLQMVIYKEDGPPDDQKQGDGGAGIVANDHPDDPASFVLLRSFANGHLQRERSPDDQNQGDGGAPIVANDHPDDPASSVLLCSFANGHLQRDGSPDDKNQGG